MSDEKNLSAIDAIYEILNRIENLEKRFIIIDDNIKLISNKISKLNKNAAQLSEIESNSVQQRSLVSEPQEKKEVERLVLGNTKTYGYLVNKAKQPVQDVTVNVYDANNRLIKNVKTDTNGYWEVRLPSGKYGVEYIHKAFKPINKTIDIPTDTKNYEVR
jgi:hypothetical protein